MIPQFLPVWNENLEMQSAESLNLESEKLRRELQQTTNCRFVNRSKFCELLISNLKLERADVANGRMRGLHDPETCIRYFIEEENLFCA